MGGEAAQNTRAVVRVDVTAAQRARPSGAHNVAADDRAAAAVAAMAVVQDRLGRAAGVGGSAVFFFVGVKALEGVPAEIGALGAGESRVVELLEAVLADVADCDPRLRRGGRVEG